MSDKIIFSILFFFLAAISFAAGAVESSLGSQANTKKQVFSNKDLAKIATEHICNITVSSTAAFEFVIEDEDKDNFDPDNPYNDYITEYIRDIKVNCDGRFYDVDRVLPEGVFGHRQHEVTALAMEITAELIKQNFKVLNCKDDRFVGNMHNVYSTSCYLAK